jgi:hypothetical protein
MAEDKQVIRSLPWAVKLVLTVLFGGALSAGTYWFFTDIFPIGAADSVIHLVFFVFWQVLVGTSVSLFERNALGTSIIKGLALGLVSTAFLVISGFLFLNWIMSNTH